jgi:hypothetical protein
VERLRKEANGVTVNLTNPWPTMREAADEIERLRAEIMRLEAKKQEPEAAARWSKPPTQLIQQQRSGQSASLSANDDSQMRSPRP